MWTLTLETGVPMTDVFLIFLRRLLHFWDVDTSMYVAFLELSSRTLFSLHHSDTLCVSSVSMDSSEGSEAAIAAKVQSLAYRAGRHKMSLKSEKVVWR